MNNYMCDDSKCGVVYRCVACHIMMCKHYIKAFSEKAGMIIKDWPGGGNKPVMAKSMKIKVYCVKHIEPIQMFHKINK